MANVQVLSQLRRVAAATCWNLHAMQAGTNSPSLNLDWHAVDLLKHCSSWLPPMVADFVGHEGVLSLDLIHPGSSPGPGHEAPQPMPFELAPITAPIDFNYQSTFVQAIEELRRSAQHHAVGSSDTEYTIAAWLAAAALTAEARRSKLPPPRSDALVVHVPVHLRRDSGMDLTHAQALTAQLKPVTVTLLPVFLEATQEAVKVAARRVQIHVRALMAGCSLSSGARAEFKDLLYFWASNNVERASASQHDRGERLYDAMVLLLLSPSMAGTIAAAMKVLQLAQVNPADRSPQNNYDHSAVGRRRFDAFALFEMKKCGLLRPELFAYMSGSKKVVPHLYALGMTDDDVAAACGQQYVVDRAPNSACESANDLAHRDQS